MPVLLGKATSSLPFIWRGTEITKIPLGWVTCCAVRYLPARLAHPVHIHTHTSTSPAIALSCRVPRAALLVKKQWLPSSLDYWTPATSRFLIYRRQRLFCLLGLFLAKCLCWRGHLNKAEGLPFLLLVGHYCSYWLFWEEMANSMFLCSKSFQVFPSSLSILAKFCW